MVVCAGRTAEHDINTANKNYGTLEKNFAQKFLFNPTKTVLPPLHIKPGMRKRSLKH